MRSVFKWRVATNKYLYITDGNPVEGSYPYGRPFLFNKKESKAYYSNEESTLLPTGVDEGKIQQFVGNINNENVYRDMYNAMVDFAKHLTIDKDVQNLTLDIDYKPYFNLDNDTCVIEAVTPKCEGYEPVFDFRVHTVDDSGNTQVVNYDFYPERNEHDKTLRYVLDFEVPKGEKGDPGNDGAGCKGDKGDQGDPGPTPFFTATASASEASGTEPEVTVEVTPDASTKPRTYNLDFKFEIPAGTPGDPGNDGNDGKDDVFTGITASAERLGYNQTPYVYVYKDSSKAEQNEVNTVWNPAKVIDPDRGVEIDGRYNSSFYMELGIPEGAPGIQGPEGRPSNIRIVDATVEETLEPGEQAQARAEVVRLESDNEFDIHLFFKIPRGQDGQDGTDGRDGQDTIRYNFSAEAIPSDEVESIVLDWDQRFLPTENDPTIIEETLQLYYPKTWGGGLPVGGEEGQVLTSHGEGVSPTWEDLPEIGDGQLTIKGDNTTIGEFTANQNGNTEIKFIGSGGTTVSGDPSGGTINIETDIIPKVSNELIYSDDNRTLTTHQLMYTGGLVVDTPEDLALCETSADPDDLILDVTPGENKVYGFTGSTWEIITDTTPLAEFLNGSRIAWNYVTDKLFYNDGANIYRIAATSEAVPPNYGTLTIKGDETTAVEFTANQSTNKTLAVKGSTGITVSGADGRITVSTESNHTVVSKTGIVERGGTEAKDQAYELKVVCDLSGETVKAVDINDFADLDYDAPRTFTWSKSASEQNVYLGLFMIGSTSSGYAFKLDIQNTLTEKTESHLYGLLVDTPDDTTFAFVSTNNWPIVCKKYSQNGQDKYVLLAYLHVPDDFVGTIKLIPLKYRNGYKDGPKCFAPTSSSDNLPRLYRWSADGDVDLTTYTSSNIYGYNIGGTIREPYGNYPVDVIGDFGGAIEVGSKISDSIINDYFLHTLNKKVDSLINSQSLTIGNTTITEAQLQALLATLQ